MAPDEAPARTVYADIDSGWEPRSEITKYFQIPWYSGYITAYKRFFTSPKAVAGMRSLGWLVKGERQLTLVVMLFTDSAGASGFFDENHRSNEENPGPFRILRSFDPGLGDESWGDSYQAKGRFPYLGHSFLWRSANVVFFVNAWGGFEDEELVDLGEELAARAGAASSGAEA